MEVEGSGVVAGGVMKLSSGVMKLSSTGDAGQRSGQQPSSATPICSSCS